MTDLPAPGPVGPPPRPTLDSLLDELDRRLDDRFLGELAPALSRAARSREPRAWRLGARPEAGPASASS